MAFTATADILRRVKAALAYDLLGNYTPQSPDETAADAAVNGHLSSPLNSTPIAEQVERYVIDPVGAGDLYAVNRQTGMTVGYSFGQNLPNENRSGTGRAYRRAMPVEVTCLRVVNDMNDILGGAAGYAIDAVMDDVQRIFESGRRDATHFGVEEMSVESIVKLDGGSVEAPWIGRIITIQFTRSVRDLQT